MIARIKCKNKPIAFIDMIAPPIDEDLLKIELQVTFASIFSVDLRDIEIVFNKRDK